MKKITSMLVALAMTIATMNAQQINGDMNHNDELDVADVTVLIEDYLTGNKEFISSTVDHYAADNTPVVGTWYNQSTAEYFILNADGTADSAMGTTYKFLPSQGRILFFNADSIPVASLNVAYITKGYLAVIPAGSDIPQICIAKEPGSPLNNGREYVDLGLSVKWAIMDIGANTPSGYGNNFAWGETETKSSFTEDNYKFGMTSNKSLSKYNTNDQYGWVDNKKVLDLTDDAARVNWGGTWRMPTSSEQDELVRKCTWEEVEVNGVSLLQVTGPNGNSIYMHSGRYWSNTLFTSNSVNARFLLVWGELVKTDWYARYEGRYVRAVCE